MDEVREVTDDDGKLLEIHMRPLTEEELNKCRGRALCERWWTTDGGTPEPIWIPVAPAPPSRLWCFVDGDALCIVPQDFEDLQSSEAMFVQMTADEQRRFTEMVNRFINEKVGVSLDR